MSDWYDWKQNQRIEAAEEQLAAERRARNRLSEQMRQQQGNLQGQINRLTTALVALIEHEDIRAELGQHADAAAVRRYARDVVSTVVVTGGAALRGSVEPADVPGYWLAAAARGVAATARGEVDGASGGKALLLEAEHRDPARTGLFLTLLAALTRDARWATAPWARVLPGQAVVTGAERQVWLAVAEGRITAPGAEDALVAALLQQAAAGGEEAQGRVVEWLRRQAGVRTTDLRVEQAAATLAGLHTVVTEGVPEAPDTETAAIGRHLAEQAGQAGQAEEAVAPAAEDPLADCLRSLVDEGSPAEGDILDRMAVVRADLGFLDERAAAQQVAWSAPAGDAVDLLLVDLAEPTDSGQHRIARRALAPTLLAVADRLATDAAAPVEQQRPVQVVGETITVGPSGAAAQWRPAVTAGVARRSPTNPLLVPLGGGAIALGPVLLALGFVGTGFLVLGIAVLLGGAAALAAGFRQRHALAQTQAATVRSTEREIERTSATIADETARGASAASAAVGHRAAVRAALERTA